jgi:hypothetical protein
LAPAANSIFFSNIRCFGLGIFGAMAGNKRFSANAGGSWQ